MVAQVPNGLANRTADGTPQGKVAIMSETAQYRADPKAAGDADPVIRQITEVVGSDRILTGEDDRAFYSQDIFAQGEIAAAVVRPRTTN
mgnify:FL=1